MNTDDLVFTRSPVVRYGTNIFINTPVILQYDDIPLIEVVQTRQHDFTSQFTIFDADGGFSTRVRGRRLFPVDNGPTDNIDIRQLRPGVWVCRQEDKTLFEIRGLDDGWEVDCELFTPDGRLIRSRVGHVTELIEQTGPIRLQGVTCEGNSFIGCSIGFHIRSDGKFEIGVA